MQFFLHGSLRRYDPGQQSFSFVVPEPVEIRPGTFLIWDRGGAHAILAKIRAVRKIASWEWRVSAFDAVPVKLSVRGLLESVGEQEISRYSDQPTPLPGDKFEQIKRILLKSNRKVLDDSYFSFDSNDLAKLPDDVRIQAHDGMHSVLRLFGMKPEDIPSGIEDTVIYGDLQRTFEAEPMFSGSLGYTDDGRFFFRHEGKRLYVQIVNRQAIETCLGIDVLYNFVDEKRLVFFQYKCPKTGTPRYYPGSDKSHNGEVQKMRRIPGVTSCHNYTEEHRSLSRLCKCPVFVKLVNREIYKGQDIPHGAYFPICIWEDICQSQPSVTVKQQPHINNDQFQALVRSGLIGTTPKQSKIIHDMVVEKVTDKRIKLVFEEVGG